MSKEEVLDEVIEILISEAMKSNLLITEKLKNSAMENGINGTK